MINGFYGNKSNKLLTILCNCVIIKYIKEFTADALSAVLNLKFWEVMDMPFVNVRTNTQFNKGRELKLKTALGEAISLIPGKSEDWLMFGLAQEIIYFKGTNDPAAMVEISIFGETTKDAMNALTAKVTAIVAEQLSIKPDRIYVSYFPTPNWGWNGSNL